MARWLKFSLLLACLCSFAIGCSDDGSLTTEPAPEPAEANKEALMKQYSGKGKEAPPASKEAVPVTPAP